MFPTHHGEAQHIANNQTAANVPITNQYLGTQKPLIIPKIVTHKPKLQAFRNCTKSDTLQISCLWRLLLIDGNSLKMAKYLYSSFSKYYFWKIQNKLVADTIFFKTHLSPAFQGKVSMHDLFWPDTFLTIFTPPKKLVCSSFSTLYTQKPNFWSNII